MLVFAITVLLLGMEPGNLLVNPGFEQGLDGWAAEPSGLTSEILSTEDANAVRLEVAEAQPVDWRFLLQDHRTRPPDKNPYMEEYPCALLAQSCFIEGLNAGVAGFSTWCMHEVYYPGGKTPMNFGLWNFADRGWSPRPIYHVVANFCRNTEAGDPVWKCLSTHPDWVKGVKAGETLFWVNLSDAPTRIEIQGFEPRTLRIMTEDTLSGDRECGAVIEGSESSRFTAPPRSFGYAKVHASPPTQ